MQIYIQDFVDEILSDEPIGISIITDTAVLGGAPEVLQCSYGLRCYCNRCKTDQILDDFEQTLSRRQLKAFHKLSKEMRRALALA